MEITVTERGDKVSGMYERTFVVAAPVERAWNAFVDPAERAAWAEGRDHMPDPGSLDTFEPGEMKVLDGGERHRRFTIAQRPGGLDGWYETTVTFEEVASGTRITLTRSGFGDSEAWRHFAESTNAGWDEMIADLVLYLERGVRASRHFSFRSGIAATTRQAGAGLEVTHVVPGGFAEAAGMRPGDLLLFLNGAPVFGIREVAFLARERAPGDLVEVEYARDREVLRGSAPLSTWNFGTGRYVGHPGGYPKPGLTAVA